MNLFWPPCWSFYDYKSLHQPEWAVAISCSRQAGVIINVSFATLAMFT